jgi:putative transposase
VSWSRRAGAALEAELTAHLGYERNDRSDRDGGPPNHRNRTTTKTVQTGVGPVPRDRAGTFEPLLVLKRAGRIAGGLDDMIISLYAHGMSVRDILHHLEQVYGTQLSHETVSRITDQVLEEVRAWQARPLEEHMSIATTRTASRQAGAACASQYAASSAVRPSTWPSSP